MKMQIDNELDWRVLSKIKLSRLATIMGEKFWEIVSLRDVVAVVTAGLMGNCTPGSKIADFLLNIAIKQIKLQAKEILEDPKKMTKQAEKVKQVRRIHSLRGLLKMDPKDFEYWVAGYFIDRGYRNVVVVPLGADCGVDVSMIDKNRQKVIVQCKRYSPKRIIGRDDLDGFFTVLHRFGSYKGFWVTTSDFSSEAKAVLSEYGNKYHIELINGKQLVDELVIKKTQTKRPKPSILKNQSKKKGV